MFFGLAQNGVRSIHLNVPINKSKYNENVEIIASVQWNIVGVGMDLFLSLLQSITWNRRKFDIRKKKFVAFQWIQIIYILSK